MKRAVLGVASLLAASPIAAQMSMEHDHSMPVSSSAQRLIEQARAATEIYTDRSIAIARGYRPVGRDLPMMGRHWINTRLLIDGTLDVTRPQILTYLEVDGKAVLTGVVYAKPLDEGQSPPDLFGEGAMWHEHNGSIDEEALVPEHQAMPSATKGTRVAFLHVWTRAPFAESVFSAENWALPFVRAGVPVPDEFSVAAAKCLSVAVGYRDYFLDVRHSRNAQALDECAAFSVKRGVSLDSASLEWLDSAWHRAEAALQSGG